MQSAERELGLGGVGRGVAKEGGEGRRRVRVKGLGFRVQG